MLRPIIFVGCGGSGGKTLRVARRAAMRRLERAGWASGIPAAWQFLHIDVPSGQEGSTDDFGPYLPAGCYVNLVQRGIEYRGVDEGLLRQMDSASGRDPEGLAELLGWRPNPREVLIPIEDGAGQYRAVGRAIAVNYARTIVPAVRNAVAAVNTNAAQAELRQLSEQLGAGNGEMDAPAFILVSSLAGGTGAGCFMDVADIIRSECGSVGDHIMAILYTSDVFRGVPGVEGVEGNSLAALSELLSGYWNTERRRMALLHKQGVKATDVARGGPAYPFLIGAGNTQGVSLRGQAEVYRAIGEALGMIAATDDVQERVINFLKTNWSIQAAGNADTLGLTPPGNRYGVASSFGYARLGLGRERFRDYALKRLVRDAAEFLESGYLAAAKANWPDQALTAVEARDRTVEFHSEMFLNRCGLNERNEEATENNQIIDALRPAELAAEWKRVVGVILGRVQGMVPAEAGTWLNRITAQAETLRQSFASTIEQAILASSAGWAQTKPDEVLATCADYIASHGIPVTVGLVQRTISEMRAVANQLVAEAVGMRVNGENWMGRVGTLLPPGQNLQGVFEYMPEVVRQATSPWYYDGEAQVREKAARLMVELADEVLTPLLGSLRAAQAALESDLGPQGDGTPSEVLDWPRDNLIPGWLLPSEVEMLLDSVDGYPATFTNLVTRALGSQSGVAEAGPLVVARREIIAGGFSSAATEGVAPGLRQEDRLAGTARTWHPRAAGGTGQASQFVAAFKVDDLLSRAAAWIDRPGPFQRHIAESLADHLSSHDSEGHAIEDHPRRLAAFQARLAAALAASAPLIEVEPNVQSLTHANRPLEIAEIIEPLPLPVGHPARPVAEEVLTSRGIDQQSLASHFGSGSGAGVGSIGIVSYIAVPVHPVVFTSVVGPIASKYQTGTAGFWQWRRTRTLVEAVPVPSEVRHAMVRGWFTARLLGLLDTRDRLAPYRVLDEGGQWLSLPYPLLGSVPDDDGLEQLAATLESLPVAFLAWGVWGDQGQVAAYRRLYRLGLSDPLNPGLFEYRKPHPVLAAWITSGQLPPGALPAPDTVDASGEPSGRVLAAEERLRAVIGAYGDVATPALTADTLLLARRGRELVPEIVDQLDLIAASVKGAALTGPLF